MSRQTSSVMYLMIVLASLLSMGDYAKADFTFGTPANLGPVVNSGYDDWGPCLSADGLALYFESRRGGGSGGYDLWVTTRVTVDDAWGTPVNLGPGVNSSSDESMPGISADGLELYFQSNRPGGSGGPDIWVTKRITKEDPWAEPVNVGPMINSASLEAGPRISADGLTLYFNSNRPGSVGQWDLWVATRTTPDSEWSAPESLMPAGYASLSADGLVIFFQDDNLDLLMAQRKSKDEPFGPAVPLPSPISTSRIEGAPYLSSDGATLYFSSERGGGEGWNDTWQVSIEPVVDFNNDGIVNIKDLIGLIEHWGQEEPAYDIAPFPCGDSLVNEHDLEILMDHWGQEAEPLAHWRLDETEGDVAYDSAGLNDATLNGNPLWQPDAGMIDGALAFDGHGDYVLTPLVLNPAEGPFSVFAWVKGGTPGQVIVSQRGSAGVCWLSVDSLAGCLTTELKGGRRSGPLVSQMVITDGDWHRVGFTWDGENRTLYVDDIVVAQDAQSSLADASAGLYIGAGKGLEPDGFWSGLIDDVRIYDRVVVP